MSWKMKFEGSWGQLDMKSNWHIAFNAPLNEIDSENQTFGCRANNPDICRYYMLESVCAFEKEDHICLQPTRSWKKQYKKLKGEN